jgi:formylglycine-generating enzyme required for sulfatase activity
MRNKGLLLLGLLFGLIIYCSYAHFKLQTNQYINKFFERSKPISRPASSDSVNKILEEIQSNMVLVDGGKYTMGNKVHEHQFIDDENEKPAHDVILSSFYICKYDVTVKEFEAFVEETGYQTSAEKFGFSAIKGDDNQFKRYGLTWRCNVAGKLLNENEKHQPVVFVSWYDAIAFVRWLKLKTGQKFRLPTEAEWEYSATGGKKSKGYKYSGSNVFDSIGWSGDNSGGIIHAVGQKLPNELGLYDMCGLEYQWLSDWAYGLYYYISPLNDPKGPTTGGVRIIRGGAWNRPNAMFQRITLRHARFPESSTSNCGFRLAMDQ